MYASIPAGGWSMAIAEDVSEFLVPDWLVPNRPGIVAIRVRGDSMAPRIEDGAIVFIDTTKIRPRSGEIVAAYLDGEATLKVYRVENRTVLLEPFNRAYQPIRVADIRHLRILGTVIGHWTPGR
jgi:repressor LexA